MAEQVQGLNRELGVWKNECHTKHDMWLRATELLQVSLVWGLARYAWNS